MSIHFSKAKRNREMLVDIEFMTRALKIGMSNNYLSSLADRSNQLNMIVYRNDGQPHGYGQIERPANPTVSEEAFEEMLVGLRGQLRDGVGQTCWFSNAISGLVDDLGEYSKIVENNIENLLFIEDYYGHGPIGKVAIASAKAKCAVVEALLWGFDNVQLSGFTLEDDLVNYMKLTADRETELTEDPDEVAEEMKVKCKIYAPFQNLSPEDEVTIVLEDSTTIKHFPAKDFKVTNADFPRCYDDGCFSADTLSYILLSTRAGETNIPVNDASTCYELFRTFEIYGIPHDKDEIA